MAKTCASKKAKGKRLENKIAAMYRHYLGIDAKRMPLSGADSMLKGDIYKKVFDGFTDEAKNQEKVKIWEWWNQAVSQCTNTKPILYISGNFRPILAILEADELFRIRQELQQYKNELRKKEKNNG